MSNRKQRTSIVFAICLIFIGGFIFAQTAFAEEEEIVDQNTKDITLTLLPKNSVSTDANTTSNAGNNGNTTLLNTGEKNDGAIAVAGYIVISMGIFYAVYRAKREVER